MLVSRKFIKIDEKVDKNPEKYVRITISKKSANAQLSFLSKRRVNNACIIFEKGNRQAEWCIVDGEIEMCPYDLACILKLYDKAILAFADQDEVEIEPSKREKKSTEFIYPGDDPGLLIGVVEIDGGVCAFLYDNQKHLDYYVEADKGEGRTSDLYGLMMGMRQRRIETNEEAKGRQGSYDSGDETEYGRYTPE